MNVIQKQNRGTFVSPIKTTFQIILFVSSVESLKSVSKVFSFFPLCRIAGHAQNPLRSVFVRFNFISKSLELEN